MDKHGGEEMAPSTSNLSEKQPPSADSPSNFVKRTLSFQLRRKPEADPPIDPKELAAIRWRYKDISKQVIWVECPMTVAQLDKGYVEIRPPSNDASQSGKKMDGGATTSHLDYQSPLLPSKSAFVMSTHSTVPEASSRPILPDIIDESEDDEPEIQITRL